MLWIIYAIISAISDGTRDFLNRVVMIKEDPYVYAFVENFLTALLFIPVFLTAKAPTNNISYLFILISSLIWTAIVIISNYSYKYTEVSLRAPISQVRVLFLLLMSILFLSEKLTISKGIGTLLIFSGMIILRFKKGKMDLKHKGIQLTILTAFLVALVAIFEKLALGNASPEFISFFVYLIPAFIFSLFMIKKKKEFKSIIKNQYKVVLLASLLGAVFYYLSLKAYALIDVSSAFPIIKTSAIVTVLLGIIVLKEKQNMLRKIIATLIILAGIAVIYY